MAWTSLTYAYGSLLTATKMTQLYDNLTALANKDSGAPVLANSYVTEAMLTSLIVSQGKLKTTTQESSVTADRTSASSGMTLTGGDYTLAGWNSKLTGGGGGGVSGYPTWSYGEGESTYSSRITLNIVSPNNINTFYLRARYVQSSPPYDLGNGEIPLFVFALVEKTTGKIFSTSIAEDPPWANNGPTSIRPDVIALDGTKHKLVRALEAEFGSLKAAETALSIQVFEERRLNDLFIPVEITQAMKQQDMPLIPHPFWGFSTAKYAVVMLDPVSAMCEQLWRLHSGASDSVAELLHNSHLQLDNTAIAGCNAPPGVMPVRARWKLTQ